MNRPPPPYPKKPASAGFTVLEMTVSVMLLSVVFSALGTMVLSTHGSFRDLTLASSSDAELRRVIDGLIHDLRITHPESLWLENPAGSPLMTFSTIQGWNEESIPGVTHSVEFREGQVFRDERVVATGVEEMSFRYDGRVLLISLQVRRGEYSRELISNVRI